MPAPKYVAIAADLRAAIERGTYGSGDRLPSETELIATYKVARMTARAAILDLVNAGLAHRVWGSGTFVGEPVATISETVTYPAELHGRITRSAEDEGLAVDAWLVRAAERDLDR